MPATYFQSPLLAPEQQNPFNAALKQAFQAYGQGLQAQYARPNMEQKLQKAIQENQWNPKIWESEIGLRGAQAGLAGSEAAKNQFLIRNPQYISPEGMLISQAMGGGNAVGGQGMPQGKGYQPTPQEQQAMSQMQPGQSMVMGQGDGQQQGGDESSPQQGTQQPSQSMDYDPNALAFNPPQLQSPTGNPLLDNLWYKKFGMSPLSQAQLELSQKQAEKYQTVNVDKNNQFNEQATFANQSTVDAHKFLDALDRVSSLETGHWFGHTPALRDATQEVEAFGNNMAASATQIFKDGKAIHESDIELQKLAKPNRLQNKDVAFDLAHGVIAKNDRMKERQQFYALATQNRLKPEIVDAMWNKYETDRPYMDTTTKMPNDAYKGSWKDYLSPQAVNSFLSGQDYTPPNQKALQGMNWTKSDLNDIKEWAYKNHLDPKQFDKRNIYKHAQEEGITLAQFKLELMKRGAFNHG